MILQDSNGRKGLGCAYAENSGEWEQCEQNYVATIPLNKWPWGSLQVVMKEGTYNNYTKARMNCF